MKNLFWVSYDGAMMQGAEVLRANYSRHHRAIASGADMRASLRAGKFAWPGGYEVFGATSDGACLCFDCIRENIALVTSAIRARDNSGWRVTGLFTDAETDSFTACDNCGRVIVEGYEGGE